MFCQLAVSLSEVCQVRMVSYCFYCISSTWMSSHLLIINSISNTLSIPHLFSGLPRQHCKTIRLAFHLKSLQLSSQPAFAVLVRKTFGKSLMLNFEADVAIFIEGMCWSEIQWVFFYAGADRDKGTGSGFWVFLLSFLTKDFMGLLLFAPQTAVCFKSYQRNKNFKQRRDTKHKKCLFSNRLEV